MLPRVRLLAALLGALLPAAPLHAADLTASLHQGKPDLKSIGPIAFGPEGIVFIGDPQGAAIFAVDTADRPAQPATGAVKVEGLDGKVASLLGTDAAQLLINGLAVNPASGLVYLSVSRGKGPDAMPVLLRVDRQGKIEDVPLGDVKFARATLSNAATKNRREAITGLAYLNGKVIVAGLSNEEFASKLRVIPFPFTETDRGASIEIFHGSHGQLETRSPVRTFVTYEIKGEPNVLAAYTCTPLVKIPVAELKAGEKVKGTTVAELGNMNQPLDMIVYQKDGKDYILMANSRRGVMKITTEGIDTIEPITKPVRSKPTAGLPYETVASLKGVMHLAKLDKDNAVILAKGDGAALNLETVPLP
jgi:hypothetical protein